MGLAGRGCIVANASFMGLAARDEDCDGAYAF